MKSVDGDEPEFQYAARIRWLDALGLCENSDSLRGFICTSGFRGAVYSLGLRATLPIPAVPLQRSTHASKRGESVARMDLSCPL